jgi:hypothetical protein
MNIRSKLAILAAFATIVVTVVGIAIPIVVKPAYAQLDDISGEQIVGEEEIPELDDIREKVEQLTSQSVPRLAEQASLTPLLRSPPACAD